MNCISTTDRTPSCAAPAAASVNPASLIGVSITRLVPKCSTKPSWLSPTSPRCLASTTPYLPSTAVRPPPSEAADNGSEVRKASTAQRAARFPPPGPSAILHLVCTVSLPAQTAWWPDPVFRGGPPYIPGGMTHGPPESPAPTTTARHRDSTDHARTDGSGDASEGHGTQARAVRNPLCRRTGVSGAFPDNRLNRRPED